jgi:hypothetical protein
VKKLRWWLFGVGSFVFLALLWAWGPRRKEVIIRDAAVRSWTAWGYRYAEIENLSERPMVVPNREGFFLYFEDPVIAEAGTKLAMITLPDVTLLPPGGALRLQIMDSYEPIFIKCEGRYLKEVEDYARQVKAVLWTTPTTPFP